MIELSKRIKPDVEAASWVVEEVKQLEAEIEKALVRACDLGHPKSRFDKRDDIELFLRDAYAAGCNAVSSRSMYTAMEYAEREAPRLRALLSPKK